MKASEVIIHLAHLIKTTGQDLQVHVVTKMGSHLDVQEIGSDSGSEHTPPCFYLKYKQE